MNHNGIDLSWVTWNTVLDPDLLSIDNVVVELALGLLRLPRVEELDQAPVLHHSITYRDLKTYEVKVNFNLK